MGHTCVSAAVHLFPCHPRVYKEFVLQINTERTGYVCVLMSCHQMAWHNNNLNSDSNTSQLCVSNHDSWGSVICLETQLK